MKSTLIIVAVPAVQPELQALLANYRKIIVLLADEKTLSDAERKSAYQVGQSLFHDNLERLARILPLLVQTQALSPAQRAAADQTLPAIKLHKRVSEDLAALEDIEKQYDQEISDIFSGLEARHHAQAREVGR